MGSGGPRAEPADDVARAVDPAADVDDEAAPHGRARTTFAHDWRREEEVAVAALGTDPGRSDEGDRVTG